jgi:hypothetical protein
MGVFVNGGRTVLELAQLLVQGRAEEPINTVMGGGRGRWGRFNISLFH